MRQPEEEGGKSVKKAGYLPSLGEGESPVWWWAGEVRRGEGWGVRLGVRQERSSLIKREGGGREKGRLCLASRESRQLSVLIRAAQYCED